MASSFSWLLGQSLLYFGLKKSGLMCFLNKFFAGKETFNFYTSQKILKLLEHV